MRICRSSPNWNAGSPLWTLLSDARGGWTAGAALAILLAEVRRLAQAVSAAIAVVATAGAVASAPTPAHAYGQGDCDAAFGAGNTAVRHDVNVDTGDVGKVDFGDHPHLVGKPQGNAVICFAKNGGVKVMGRLFADVFPCCIAVRVKIDIFYRSSSGETTQAGSTTVRTLYDANLAEDMYVQRVGSSAGRVYVAARVRLYFSSTAFGTPTSKKFDRTYTRGGG